MLGIINMDTVFKKGDRVFDAMLGWGETTNFNNYKRNFEVLFDTGTRIVYEEDGSIYDYQERNCFKPTLSFTEYKLEGFTQERPEVLPNKGDVVWVRDHDEAFWIVVHFIKKVDNKYIVSNNNPFTYSYTEYDEWNFMTTKNPYTNEGSI